MQTHDEQDRQGGLVAAGQPDRAHKAFGDLDEQVREDSLRLALDTIPALLDSAEPDGSLDYFNQRWLDYLGVSLDDIKGWRWISKIHPDDVDIFLKKWRASLRTGEPLEAEARVRRHDGVYRWMLHRKVPLRDETGKVSRWYGSSSDIDELKRNEFYLAEAQRLSHTGSCAWNVATDELIWSEENCRILGYERSVKPTLELIRDRVHPDDLGMWEAAVARGLEGKPVDFEHRLLMPDGSVKHVHVVVYGVQKDGRLVELFGTARDITERKRAEEVIRRSEAYLAEAQKLSHTGSWSASPKTGIDWWSEECYRVLGFDPRDGLPSYEELVQRVHPDDRAAFRGAVEWHIREGHDLEMEYRIVCSDGAIRNIQSIGHAVLSPSGDLCEVVGTVIDITERKRAEENLRASEAKYRHLVDTTPAFIHTTLPNGDVDFYNRGWLEYVGLPLTEFLGRGWAAVIHPDDAETIVRWRAAVEAGEPFVGESRVRRVDGEYRWFLHRVEPLRNGAGEIIRWYGSSIEIEERKIAEEAIRRSEAYLAQAQKLSHTGTSAYNPVTRKSHYWSEETYRIWGFEPQQSPPDSSIFLQWIHPEDRDRALQAHLNAVHERKGYDQEFRIVRPDGAVRHVHIVGHPVISAGGELIEYVSTHMDVTEHKLAEEAIRSGEAALQDTRAELERVTRVTTMGELTSSIAHEVNQPLGTITNNATVCLDLLSSGKLDLDELREPLNDILTAAERGSAVIQRVRAMAKRSAPQRAPLRLADVVNAILALTTAESVARRIPIRAEIAADLPLVVGDRVQLQQVLLNLVMNAMDAMNEVVESARKLEIIGSLDKRDSHPAVRISVRDCGIGLQSGQVDRLFEAFYTTKPEGMGLGLAICRSIVEAHGGRLWAESNNGPGATFAFSVPAASGTG